MLQEFLIPVLILELLWRHLTVPWIAEKMGWNWAFILTGAIGFIWLIFMDIYL